MNSFHGQINPQLIASSDGLPSQPYRSSFKRLDQSYQGPFDQIQNRSFQNNLQPQQIFFDNPNVIMVMDGNMVNDEMMRGQQNNSPVIGFVQRGGGSPASLSGIGLGPNQMFDQDHPMGNSNGMLSGFNNRYSFHVNRGAGHNTGGFVGSPQVPHRIQMPVSNVAAQNSYQNMGHN